MSTRVVLHHRTHYTYDQPVRLSPHVFRLRPAAHTRTPVEAYALTIKPAAHFINWQQDPFGNFQARVVFTQPTTELSVEVEVTVNLVVFNPFDFFLEDYAARFPFAYDAQLRKNLAPYLETTEDGPLLTALLAGIDLSPQPTVAFLVMLNQLVFQRVAYTVRLEPGVQTAEDTLAKALGSCRDSAWLLVQLARHLGLGARFVSGYLVQLVADAPALDGPAGPTEDFTDLHAWAEVYAPGAGWIGLDPTSGLLAGEGHIPLACTPDPASAAPVSGTLGGSVGHTTFTFSHTVTRLREEPRMTRPHPEEA